MYKIYFHKYKKTEHLLAKTKSVVAKADFIYTEAYHFQQNFNLVKLCIVHCAKETKTTTKKMYGIKNNNNQKQKQEKKKMKEKLKKNSEKKLQPSLRRLIQFQLYASIPKLNFDNSIYQKRR